MMGMEMDPEKMEKMKKQMEEMGLSADMVDEKLMWTFKKVSMKLMKLRLILDEKGVSEDKAKEIAGKIVDMAFDKDLAKIKEWHKEHEEMHKDKEKCC